jgi:hypothetical protein
MSSADMIRWARRSESLEMQESPVDSQALWDEFDGVVRPPQAGEVVRWLCRDTGTVYRSRVAFVFSDSMSIMIQPPYEYMNGRFFYLRIDVDQILSDV